MKTLRIWLAGIAVACLLSGCGSGGDGGGTTATDFTGFVKGLVAATDDTSEPVEINSVEFSSTEDEAAFDDLF